MLVPPAISSTSVIAAIHPAQRRCSSLKYKEYYCVGAPCWVGASPRHHWSNLWRAVLVLSLVFIAAAAPAVGGEPDRLGVGEEAPVFRLKTMNGDTVKQAAFSISDYVGDDVEGDKKKALLLSFFASYCEPCKKELPFLSALYKEYASKGLVVASVSIDKDDVAIAKVSDLIAKLKPEHFVMNDHYQVVAKRYYVKNLPAVYLIDPDRKITLSKVGYDAGALKEVFDNVRRSLGIAESEPVPASLQSYVKGKPAATADSSDGAPAKKRRGKKTATQ